MPICSAHRAKAGNSRGNPGGEHGHCNMFPDPNLSHAHTVERDAGVLEDSDMSLTA